MTRFLSQDLGVVGIIDPDAYAVGTFLTGAIDMSLFHEVLFIVQVGDFVATGVANFSVKSSDTSGGTYAALSPARAITALTEAGTDSNKQALVRVRAEHLADGQHFLKGELILTVAGADAAVIVIAGLSRQAPASADDLASVDEIVN